jgi:hypothetical protein
MTFGDLVGDLVRSKGLPLEGCYGFITPPTLGCIFKHPRFRPYSEPRIRSFIRNASMTFVGGPLTSSFADMHNFVKSFSLRGPLGGVLRIRNTPQP